VSSHLRPALSAEGLLRTLRGHEGSIWALDFGCAGTVLATGGRDRTIRLWQMPHGQPLRTFQAHEDWVSCLAFNARSDVLASGSEDTTVRLWGVPDGSFLGTLRGHDRAVRCVAFHPTQDVLASGSDDQHVCLWNRRGGRPMQRENARVGEVLALAFGRCDAVAPSGAILAGGGKGGGVMLWQMDEAGRAEEVQCMGWTSGPVTSLAFSSDGQLLAAGGEAGLVQIWQARRADALYVPIRTIQAPAPVWNVAFTGSGRVLVSGGGDGAIRFWRLRDGAEIRVLKRHVTSAWGLRFSPTGWLLASSGTGADSEVNLWWVLREKPLAEATPQDLEWVTQSLWKQAGTATEGEEWSWQLLEALLRAKFCFDIALDEPAVISVGEFDIEIESVG